MGQKVSGLTNKVTRSVSSLFSHSEETQESSLATQRATPFVYKRTRLVLVQIIMTSGNAILFFSGTPSSTRHRKKMK